VTSLMGFEGGMTRHSRDAMVLCTAAVMLLGSRVESQSAPAPMAQPPAASAANQGVSAIEPHLKANTDEVLLDLVVREHGRNGVPKLRPEDLIVTDEGTPVKLQDLHLVNVGSDPARKPLVTIVFDPFHGPIAKSTRIVALRLLNALPATGFRMAVSERETALNTMVFSDYRRAGAF
jgi:hypothetical protein